MEYISEYVKPELLILIPVLYFVGVALKKGSKVQNKNIPLTLSIIGVILSMISVLSDMQATSFRMAMAAIFTAITQGVLCAGGSVFVHEIIRQYSQGNANSNNNSGSNTDNNTPNP